MERQGLCAAKHQSELDEESDKYKHRDSRKSDIEAND